MKIISLLCVLFVFSSAVNTFSQGKNYDEFSKKDLPNWSWTGIEMKYSHDQDNKENGFAEIHSTGTVKPKTVIGRVTKTAPHVFTAGNYINVMMEGVNADVSVRFQLLYDVDNNGKFNEDKDIMLTSKPLSLNFSGWKEVKVKLDQNNFKLISKFDDNFSVTEDEIFAFQLEFETGKDFKESKFLTGIALISEIVSKENFTVLSDTEKKAEESLFSAKNYPNPFNPTTTINYTLKESASVRVTIYDRLGREVVTLVDESQSAGTHSVDFNASNLPSGVYFYRIKANDKTEVKKMNFVK